MSPIADITHRLPRVGKIRLGEQVPTERGTRPSKLNTFRITSQSEHVVEAVAAQYGGEPKPWAAPDGTSQFEVVIDSDTIDVLITPGDDTFSQWNEQWSAAGCQRRCDGIVEQLSGDACMCPADKDERAELAKSGRACKPTTRVSVVLPKVPALGSFTMESHGFYAASELASTFALLDMSGARNGRLLPARLRLEQRVSKKDGETKRYAVPVLEIHMSLDALIDTFGELPAAPTPDTPALPAAPTTSTTSTTPDTPKPVTSRKAAATRKTTREMSREINGVDPISDEELAKFKARLALLDEQHLTMAAHAMNDARVNLKSGPPTKKQAITVNRILVEVEAAQAAVWEDRRKTVFAALTGFDPSMAKDAATRHQFVKDATGGETESTQMLTQAQANAVVEAAGGTVEVEQQELGAAS